MNHGLLLHGQAKSISNNDIFADIYGHSLTWNLMNDCRWGRKTQKSGKQTWSVCWWKDDSLIRK